MCSPESASAPQIQQVISAATRTFRKLFFPNLGCGNSPNQLYPLAAIMFAQGAHFKNIVRIERLDDACWQFGWIGLNHDDIAFGPSSNHVHLPDALLIP